MRHRLGLATMNSCRRKVGTGSIEHDFIGDFMTICHTSASVYWRKDISDDGAWLITGGGGNPAVSFQISAIFVAKKAAKSSALWLVDPVTSLWHPNMDDNERQMSGDELPHCISRSVQYCSFFA